MEAGANELRTQSVWLGVPNATMENNGQCQVGTFASSQAGSAFPIPDTTSPILGLKRLAPPPPPLIGGGGGGGGLEQCRAMMAV